MAHGVNRKTTRAKRTPSADNEPSSPPAKRNRTDTMLRKRIETAKGLKDAMKIQTVKKETPLK